MPQSDHALIEAFQQGDEFAFAALYNRYKGPVFAFCVKMLLDRAAAQDVMQETFARVYENRQRLLNAASFKSWLFTIARNQCLNTIRRNERHVPLHPEIHEPANPGEATPFGKLLKAEQIELVNKFLTQLSPEYREVLVLREYQNLSYDEIAAVTRNTVSSVKSRLFKARRKLGEFLKPWMEASESDPKSNRPPRDREHAPVLRRVK
ncbi:MAG: RNA polymerase sigma factor [Rubricoccaceae bacterium]|nr:RNA polymerase sigma factor [Rubricoccaceae bacterium]